MTPVAYWRQSVHVQPQWDYDVAKPAHVALIACALAALTPLSLLVAVIVAAVAYFGVGKILVSAEIIPHGAHKPLSAEAIHWCGEIALCALPIALVIAWTHRLALLAAAGLLAIYLLVILATPETPT